MPANVETMFSVRETPWHGLGRIIMDAPASREALELAGLDWQVESRNIYSGTGAMIPGYRANVRSTDDAVLGVVSDRYRIVQNEEAFQFTDDLLGEGVTYETAGSLQGGKKVWMLAKLPEKYIIAGDEVTPYPCVLQQSRWQFWCQGRHDSCSRRLPEHPESGFGYCKAYLDCPPYRKCSAPGAGCP